MQLSINNKMVETAADNLQALAEELELPLKGVAVAVNNRMVTREAWSTYRLQEGMQVVIIKAACGG